MTQAWPTSCWLRRAQHHSPFPARSQGPCVDPHLCSLTLIRIQPVPRRDADAADNHRHVAAAGGALARARGRAGQRLDTDGNAARTWWARMWGGWGDAAGTRRLVSRRWRLAAPVTDRAAALPPLFLPAASAPPASTQHPPGQRGGVAHTAVDHQPLPAVLGGHRCQDVAQHRGLQGGKEGGPGVCAAPPPVSTAGRWYGVSASFCPLLPLGPCPSTCVEAPASTTSTRPAPSSFTASCTWPGHGWHRWQGIRIGGSPCSKGGWGGGRQADQDPRWRQGLPTHPRTSLLEGTWEQSMVDTWP